MNMEEMYFNEIQDLDISSLAHEGRSKLDGAPVGSGRFPLGSGDNPFQRDSGFASRLNEIKKEHPDWNNTQIAHEMNMSTGEFRAKITTNKEAKKIEDIGNVVALKQHGYSNREIGNKLGLSEGTVRNYLKPQDNALGKKTVSSIALRLKDQVDAMGMLDIGAGVERELGVSDVTLDAAARLLKANGYSLFSDLTVPQATNPGAFTHLKVLAPPGMTKKDVFNNLEDIRSVADYDSYAVAAAEKHPGFERTRYGMYYPQSISSDRIAVNYGTEDHKGGTELDGLIELRRGVEDISLGKSNYAQVRIAVDDKYYLKGMAIYSDDLPDGVDVRFNTKHPEGTPLSDVLKKFKTKEENGKMVVDRDNVFGAAIKPEEKGGQRFYIGPDGKEHLSAINIVNSEGDWLNWKKRLSSQFLAKQNLPLITQQLDITYQGKLNEFEDIMAITNPVIRQKYLQSFADDCDASAVHLKAAALPGQTSALLLPLPNIPEGQIYAPNYHTGDVVALVRHPHGGTFEIPVLKVNNEYKPGLDIIGQAPDAVGINMKAAAQLSGADFDGDTALVIPISRGGVGTKIKASPQLRDLNGFDTSQYEITNKESPLYLVDAAHGFRKQDQMGKISNLIMDMTLKGAVDEELARAVKHSMVIIDAEKHHLDWRQSAKDNKIKELYIKYQGKAQGGASTLITKAKSPKDIPKRRTAYTDADNPNIKNGIDILTGQKAYKDTGESYHKPIYEYKRDENGIVLKDKNGHKIKETMTIKDPKTGKDIQKAVIAGYEEKETIKKQSITKMQYALETYGDAGYLVSDYQTQQELAYANYANRVYALANRARKELSSITTAPYTKSAAENYKTEVESLNNKLDIALKNSPRERQAQLAANWVFKTKKQDNPNMSSEDEKKIKSQALAEARIRYGAKKERIDVTDREWEAIQAGAISANKLKQILENTDMDKLRDKAMPKDYKNQVSETKATRIRQYLEKGYSPSAIADILGVTVSAVDRIAVGFGSQGDSITKGTD